jgi:hypothetical protein
MSFPQAVALLGIMAACFVSGIVSVFLFWTNWMRSTSHVHDFLVGFIESNQKSAEMFCHVHGSHCPCSRLGCQHPGER